MMLLLAFKLAGPSLFVLGSPHADASPDTLCQQQPLGMDVGKPQHTHTQSHRLLSWLSQLSPLFLQGRYAGSDGVYQVCMGREWLLGFKEQIRPSKRLSAPNTAYSPSRAEHHLSSHSSLSSGATEDSFTVFTACPCCQQADSAQPRGEESSLRFALCLCISSTSARSFALGCISCTCTGSQGGL